MHSKNFLLGLSTTVQLVSAQEAIYTPHPTPSSLLRRDETPMASCPEQFGNEPMNCDDSACGGQGNAAGLCKNNGSDGKPCQCKVGTAGAPAPINTIVTKTNADGATIVGVYDLITIDKYKSLKQSQTVTISQTTTGANGEQTVAAVAALIAAGGVAWILGTSANAADAALLSGSRPEPPTNNKDDSSCPANKHKCSECLAVPGINICVSPDGGCGCDEDKSCPSDDKQPKCNDSIGCLGVNDKCTIGEHSGCSCKGCPAADKQPKCEDNTNCKGVDGKCTAGENSGCSCKSCPADDKQPKCNDDTNCKGFNGMCTVGENSGCSCNSCPAPENTPYCDYCGGKGNDGKCKGISDANNLWQGCKCWDFAADLKDGTMDQSKLPSSADLADLTPSDYSYSGDDPLKCMHDGFGARHDDLRQSALEWCKTVDGKKLTKSGSDNTIWKRHPYSYYSYWLGAQYDGESGGNCGESTEVREIHCVSTMLEELDDCNSGEPEFHGAELTDGCVRYYIALSRSTNDNDPPWKQLTQNSAECSKNDEDTTTVDYSFWQGVSKKFCKDVGEGKSKTSADLTGSDLQTRSNSKRAPPPSAFPADAYKDWKFHFEWEPTGNGFCSKTCDEAMSSIAAGCGHYGGSQKGMVKKGSVDVGCGSYSYSLEGPPPTTPPSADGTGKSCVPADNSHNLLGMHRDEAHNSIIPQFCSRGDVKDQTFGKDTGSPKLDYRSLSYPDIMVNLEITRNNECNDRTTTYVSEDKCKHLLGDILLDGCNEILGDKLGGTVNHSCLTYSIKSTPFTGGYVHGTCTVDIIQYKNGHDFKIDAELKDSKGGLLAQCHNEKAKLDSAVLCQTNNHSMLKYMMQITQRRYNNDVLNVRYQDEDFFTDDKNCKGGKEKFKDGKRNIQCTWNC